jgi:hypothetical protein
MEGEEVSMPGSDGDSAGEVDFYSPMVEDDDVAAAVEDAASEVEDAPQGVSDTFMMGADIVKHRNTLPPQTRNLPVREPQMSGYWFSVDGTGRGPRSWDRMSKKEKAAYSHVGYIMEVEGMGVELTGNSACTHAGRLTEPAPSTRTRRKPVSTTLVPAALGAEHTPRVGVAHSRLEPVVRLGDEVE